MRRIPKSAQRHIDAMARVRAANAASQAQRQTPRCGSGSLAPDAAPPRRMDLLTTPQEVLRSHDVYFNGVKQRLCTFACVDTGVIKRYKTGVGNIPAKGRDGNVETETLHGEVRIVRKGSPLGPE